MPRTRIKVCGITRPEDAALAADLGADAVGLNFVGGPRLLGPDQAVRILEALPPMITTVVLLFVDEARPSHFHAAVEAASKKLHFHDWARTRQIYGFTEPFLTEIRDNIDPECAHKPDTWIPLSVSDRASILQLGARVAGLGFRPGAVLLDTAAKGQLGVTGQTFKWSWIAEARAAGELEGVPPIILAGGLTPENVGEAIRVARPYAVDVSSGVELPGKPGIKDPARLRAFIDAVRAADASL